MDPPRSLRPPTLNATVCSGKEECRFVSFVDLLEGTATQLGDPIEFAALLKCFKAREREAGRGERPRHQGVVLGAVKSLIGHLESCAGMAGLVKLCMSMRHQAIAPIMHFTTINKSIPIVGSHFSLPNEAIHWNTMKQSVVGGVSSFGVETSFTLLLLLLKYFLCC